MLARTSPAFCLLRAHRLLDPDLSGLKSRPGSGEAEWLADALLVRRVVDEPRTANELAAELLRLDRDPLDGLFKLAQDVLEIREGVPQWTDPNLWHVIVRDIDTDLLVAARLAWEYYPPGPWTVVSGLAWPSVLKSDAFAIEQVLTREIVDTHVHLGGALPASFYWIASMSGFAQIYRLMEWSEDSRLWPDTLGAAKERREDLARQLFHPHYEGCAPEVTGLEFPHRELPEEAFLDPLLQWLLPDAEERSLHNPALGERYLLWTALALWLRDRLSADLRKQVLLYLRARGSFIRKLTYDSGLRGLSRFQAAFRRQHLLFFDRVRGERRKERRRRRAARAVLRLERFRTRHALRYQFSDPADAPWARDQGADLGEEPQSVTPWRPPRQVELRVTPLLSTLQTRVLHAYLQGVEDFVRYDRDAPPLRVGLVFHVHRGDDTVQVRETARWQVEGLLEILDTLPELRAFVVGVDAAGQEMSTPPRDLSDSFLLVQKRVREQVIQPGKQPIHLGRTCHAGEDFRDLLTGLRYVDEAVALLDLQPGERIGHGLALAFDPEDWYRGRSHTYPLSSDHLLDLLWGRFLARKADSLTNLVPDADLDHALGLLIEEMIGVERTRAADTILECFHDIGTYGSERDLLSALGVPQDAVSMFPTAIDAKYVQAVKSLRRRVLQRVERAQVVIEVCPTSNFLIAGLPSYSQLPYRNLDSTHLVAAPETPRIPFSINSDDPGMFQTTVTNEYRLLGQAMIDAGYERWAVARWLDEARSIGLASTFIPPWSPPTRQELLARIRRLSNPLYPE